MKERTILHSDVNNFFASVECATNPQLFGKPVAVTGNPQKRTGIILAKNEIAKRFGVKTGEAIWQAQQKCPNLITVGPHYELYEKISKKLHELYLDYTDFVEPLGLDECWLDVTDSLKILGKNGKEIADEIRNRVKQEFGFTVSIGVSFSKLYAKLGSDYKKPDATTEFTKENFKEKTYLLPLNSIVGIGSRLTKKFEKINILTIQDFVNLKTDFIKSIMGKVGVELQQKLLGEFDDPVACYYNLSPPKSIGNGTTTITDIIQKNDVEKVVRFLSEKISQRMTKQKFQGSSVGVTIKTSDFERYHHSKSIHPICSSEDISNEAMKLIDSFWDYSKHIRAIRIRMSSLSSIEHLEQLSLFNDKTNKLNESVKEIKEKFGDDKIFIASDTASFINRKGHEN